MRESDRESATSTWIVHDRFFDLYDEMIGETALEDVLARLSDVVCREMDAHGTTVYLMREESRELEARTVVANVPRLIRIPISESSLAGFCAISRRAFLIDDAYGDLSRIDPRLTFDASWDRSHDFRTRDVMCAPAIFRDEVVGVVQVVNSLHQPFTDLQLRALKSIARLVGYVLYHARMYNDLATMKQLQREKAKFMRVMVHELKSPVSAAKMSLQLLERGMVPEERRAALLGRIGERLDGLLGMIGETLELSRLSAGESLGEITVLDLTEHVRRMGDNYREQAEAKGLGFELAISSEAVPVRFDTQGLQVVLSNLLSNAVKYTERGNVALGLVRRDAEAIVTVKDSGIGIPAADVPKLFREFFRASNARGSNIQGTGVGLAGAKELVERFGGTMELTSEQNVGSTFTVHLPVAESGSQ